MAERRQPVGSSNQDMELERDPALPAMPVGERLIEPLTRRELEILGLVCDGYSNQEISDRTDISVPTVKYHLLNIFGKLSVRRRTQAVAVAVHLRLVRPGWLLGAGVEVGGQERGGHRTWTAPPTTVLM
jgi:ATP/maltotriose-dependent transcriptional regulator MalT